ncbi:glucosyltransferase domain-containing protein [Maricaulis sp.]|uniref:glucosyltransferase domain-containing protein n=1 Tax=Maricaulis sp. TaxID=1486257 RepID=UPI00260ECEE7|nr:glucosyltransferase domain-containing protein [Maricaulis sp.]
MKANVFARAILLDAEKFLIEIGRGARDELVDRRGTIIYFLVLGIFTYFIFLSQFLLDNHAFRMPWLAENEQVQNGRWMGPVIGWIHYGANVPVVMPMLSISATILSTLIVIRIYNNNIKTSALLIFGSLIIVCPINLAFFYYGFMSPIFFFANAFACASALLLSRLSLWRFVIAVAMIVFMFATYQAAVGVLAVLVLTGVIWRSCANEGTGRQADANIISRVVVVWAPALGALCATILGLTVYMLSIQYLPDNGKAIDISDFGALANRVRQVSFVAFRHLLATQPDMLDASKAAFGMLVVAAVMTSLVSARTNLVSLFSLVVAWPLAVLATKAIFFISDPGGIYQYRYNSGLIYFYAFCALFTLERLPRGVVRKAMLALSLFVIIVSVQADLVRQHVLLRGQQRDLATFNRILYRIESLEEFDPNQRYDLVRVGHLPRYRLQLLRSRGRDWDEIADGHMDYGEISDLWVDDHVFGLLGSAVKLTYGPTQTAQQIREEGLLEGRTPWPAPSSVFIDGDRIVIYIG